MLAFGEPGQVGSRAAYHRDTEPVLRQRFTVAMAVFLFFMGIGTFFEATYYPHRARFAIIMYGVEAAAALLGVAASWVPPLRVWPGGIAATAMVVITACICTYHGTVGALAERLATVLGCVLNLLSVLLPWGWRAQTMVAVGAVASFGVAAPFLVTSDAPAIPAVVVLAGATTSVCGALFLDRYRFEAFRRSALETEEAEIAAALTHVGQTLSKNLGQANALEQVARLTAGALACDWASLFLFDEGRGIYWLAANVGSRPEVVTELSQIEFPPDSLPLLEAFRPGQLIEISDASSQDLVPVELMRRTDAASALYAPVARGDKIIGVLVGGYRLSTGPFSDRQHRLMLGIAHATAITLENGRLIADLQAANNLKSEFVATMSHELRTPLNVIMGYTEMLADGAFDPNEVLWKDTVGRINARALELLELVNATLDLGRLESGRETVAAGSVDVGDLFAELARELEPLRPAGVTLAWQNESGTERIVTDRVKLKTVLKNLVGNALKFTSAGRVDVHASRADGVLTLRVSDTGIGIAPEHLPLIFDMFRQVDSSSTRRFSGVGLGLYIVRGLLDVLSATIEVTSTVGTGSSFVIQLRVDHALDRTPPWPTRASAA